MSAYKKFKTKMTRMECLIAALEEVKPEWHGQMIVDPSGNLAPLGYTGDDRTQSNSPEYHANSAVIIIPGTGSEKAGRGKNVVGGASNDISVERAEDGTFALNISANESGTYNEDFRDSVMTEYGLMERLQDAIKGAGAGNIQIDPKQSVTHPDWGQVVGVPIRVRVRKSELA